MDSVKIDELERLAKAATPGPWCSYYEDIFKWTFMLTKKPIATAELPGNARYIVAACNAVPELVARVRELERQNAGLEARLRYLTEERDTLEWELNDIKRGLEAAKETGE